MNDPNNSAVAQEPVIQNQSPQEKEDPSGEKKKRQKMKASRNVIVWARDILIALVVALIIMQFIKPTIVREHSMLDTLDPNDYIFLNKQAYFFGDVQRRDIVVFHSSLDAEDGTKKNLIKRVIALPGERVSIHDGGVYVNDNRLYEPYTAEGFTEGEMQEFIVPDGQLFLLGDNRQQSTDSRDPRVGPVPEDLLVGKAFFRIIPLKNFGVIN